LGNLRDEVQGWQGREGVIVKLGSGLWIKIKTNWWQQNGWSRDKAFQAKEQMMEERTRIQRLESRSKLLDQRLAVVAWPKNTGAGCVKVAFPNAVRAEMVYGIEGRLSVVVVSFVTNEECATALNSGAQAQGKPLVISKAYSRRARTHNGRDRVIVHTWTSHGCHPVRRGETEYEKQQVANQQKKDDYYRKQLEDADY
jgi:hypothetical protein